MDNWDHEPRSQYERVVSCDYEPPRVERVLTPMELEREVLYAGDVSPDSDG